MGYYLLKLYCFSITSDVDHEEPELSRAEVDTVNDVMMNVQVQGNSAEHSAADSQD